MAARGLDGVQAALIAGFGELAGVFSTPQWGGRAYKLPGPNGNRKRPKLLAHVVTTRDGKAITVQFKLAAQRAADVVEQYEWITPHSFRTLAPSGWISARLTTKRQTTTVLRLLRESGLGGCEPSAYHTRSHDNRVPSEIRKQCGGLSPPQGCLLRIRREVVRDEQDLMPAHAYRFQATTAISPEMAGEACLSIAYAAARR